MTSMVRRLTGIEIYSVGLVHLSVCAPKDMSVAEIEAAVNADTPTGLSHGWKVDDAPTFAEGKPNPCLCENDGTRLHYLMVC